MTTPVRRQYLRIHQQYPDAILLFRMGDFYETFDEDGQLVRRGNIIDGRADGLWESFDEDGNLTRKVTFINGELFGTN